MKILLIRNQALSHMQIQDRHVEQIKALDSSLEVVVCEEDNEAEIRKNLKDADVLAGVNRSSSELVKEAKNVKWIHAFSAGVDKILIPEVVNSDIIVSNSSGIHAVPIAEHILAFMLVFARQFHKTIRNQEKKIWEKQSEATELLEKTVLIVGLGNIGREAARLANAVGAHVRAIDVNTDKKPEWIEEIKTPEYIAEELGNADFVVCALPLTPKTEHYFSEEQFSQMKPSSVFINIGRGQVVDEKELIAALRDGVIAGAGLDVMEEEPLPQDS